MAITTACLLKGDPNYEDVAQAVKRLLGAEVSVEQPLAVDHTLFVLSFADPQTGYSQRMTVILEAKEPSLCEDTATRCSFYGEGRVTEILAMLALHFGGWITVDTDSGDWTEATPPEPVAAPTLSAIDELNLELSRVLPPSVAVELRKVAADEAKFTRVMAALDVYRERAAAAE